MKNDSPNFLDSRTLTAIGLVCAVFLGWEYYMKQKYPDSFATKAATASGTLGAHTEPGESPKSTSPSADAHPPEASPTSEVAESEQLMHYGGTTMEFDISSQGMGVKGVRVLKYQTRQGEVVELARPRKDLLALETRLLGHTEPLRFKVEQINPRMFVGHAHVGGVEITKTLEINEEKYLLDYKVSANGNDDRFVGLSTALSEEMDPNAAPSGGLLHPKYQKQEFYIDSTETHDRVVFGKDDVQKSWNKVRIAAVGSQYFTQAVLDHSSIMPEAKAQLSHGARAADISLQYPVLNRGSVFELAYSAFVGPKSVELLREVDENLAKVVDFGFFSWIGRHILELLKVFYAWVGNWGIAIICLTLVVRLLVLPINLYSYKSMRAMQAIQPQIQALRERYKDDQQKQQQEMMVLMKSNKVNPLGGCLPLFLQFPIFIALYQVLGNSIELYQAPFGLWIHDLSLKDPFYVLPVFMGITMFVQQKITPNTMDPAQAKILMFMPLMFAFFMVSLPSGLTLYMFVGALFSVVQQAVFMKRGAAAPATGLRART